MAVSKLTTDRDIRSRLGQNVLEDLHATLWAIDCQACGVRFGRWDAVIVMAAVWTVGQWLTPPATRLLIASGTPTAFNAYNVLMAVLLLVGIATFVLVGLWLGQAAQCRPDRLRPAAPVKGLGLAELDHGRAGDSCGGAPQPTGGLEGLHG